MYIPVWEQQVVSRHVFTPYDCLLISVAFVVLCRDGCLWVTGTGVVKQMMKETRVRTRQLFIIGTPVYSS